MAASAGPDIVEDGLVLYLDAGNEESYPGTGTTWKDLSGNGNNGTLTNGPTFNGENMGSVSFDGTNDYAEIVTRNTNLEFQPTQPFSVFCWIYDIGNTGYGALLANMQTGGSHFGWDLWKDNTNALAMHVISVWNGNAIKVKITINDTDYINKWGFFGYTYDGSCPTTSNDALSSVNFFIDGQINTNNKTTANGGIGFDSTSEVTSYNASQRFRIASRWANNTISQPAAAFRLGKVVIYNYALSPEEVLQNYNATKSRFYDI